MHISDTKNTYNKLLSHYFFPPYFPWRLKGRLTPLCLEATSSLKISSAVSLHPRAPALSLAWTRLLAPGIGRVPLHIHQFNAIWAQVLSLIAAISLITLSSPLTLGRVDCRSPPPLHPAVRGLFPLPPPEPFAPESSNLPVRIPWANGEYANVTIPIKGLNQHINKINNKG